MVVWISDYARKTQLEGNIYFEKHGGIFRRTGAHVRIRQYKLLPRHDDAVEQQPRELETRYSEAI
jgi:hypothetical protein